MTILEKLKNDNATQEQSDILLNAKEITQEWYITDKLPLIKAVEFARREKLQMEYFKKEVPEFLDKYKKLL